MPRPARRLLVALAAALLAAAAAGEARAQPAGGLSVVEGTVRDGAGQTLPGASVYLSGTTRGASAGADGRYRIAGIPAGTYRLVGSLVGYRATVQDVRLAAGDTLAADLALAEVVGELGTVRVRAQADRRWQRRLAQFRRALLGESSRAEHAQIVNPEVLDFSSRWGVLRATAAAPLVIENRALGYRLRYDLHAFEASGTRVGYDGDEVFEELDGSAADRARWADARADAYRGSLEHLLRSLLDGTAETEGFALAVSRDDPFPGHGRPPPPPARAADLVRRRPDGTARFAVRGRLEVVYAEPEDRAYVASRWFRERRQAADAVQRSAVRTARGGVGLDADGTPDDPFGVTVSGYLAFERLADRVPRGYVPSPPEP